MKIQLEPTAPTIEAELAAATDRITATRRALDKAVDDAAFYAGRTKRGGLTASTTLEKAKKDLVFDRTAAQSEAQEHYRRTGRSIELKATKVYQDAFRAEQLAADIDLGMKRGDSGVSHWTRELAAAERAITPIERRLASARALDAMLASARSGVAESRERARVAEEAIPMTAAAIERAKAAYLLTPTDDAFEEIERSKRAHARAELDAKIAKANHEKAHADFEANAHAAIDARLAEIRASVAGARITKAVSPARVKKLVAARRALDREIAAFVTAIEEPIAEVRRDAAAAIEEAELLGFPAREVFAADAVLANMPDDQTAFAVVSAILAKSCGVKGSAAGTFTDPSLRRGVADALCADDGVDTTGAPVAS
jgi:hypothetical protein